MSLFWENYKYHFTVKFKLLIASCVKSQVQADILMKGRRETYRSEFEKKSKVQPHKSKQARGIEMTWAVIIECGSPPDTCEYLDIRRILISNTLDYIL
jgi:hypothetical protein